MARMNTRHHTETQRHKGIAGRMAPRVRCGAAKTLLALAVLLAGICAPSGVHGQFVPAPGGTGFWYYNLFLMVSSQKVRNIAEGITEYECTVRNNLAHFLRLRVRPGAPFHLEAYFLNIHTQEKVPMYAPDLPAPPHLVDLTMFVGETQADKRPYVVITDKYSPVLIVFPSRFMVRDDSQQSWRFIVRVTKQ